MIETPVDRWRLPRLVLLALCGALAVHLLVVPLRVEGASMSPYADDGDLLVAARPIAIRPGDVVALRAGGDWRADVPGGRGIVKRVIAVEGQRVTCCADGALVVDGEPLPEDYLAPATVRSRIAFDLVVPEGHIWVLGDNRDISRDSRLGLADAARGAVPTEDVIAVVWMSLR